MQSLEVSNIDYRVPRDLEVTPWSPRRLLVLGSCSAYEMAVCWQNQFETTVDLVVAHFPIDPGDCPASPQDYDMQIIMPALRVAMIEDAGYATALKNGSSSAYFDRVVERTREMLRAFGKWANEIPTVVSGFIVPLSQPTGRHQPRFDLTNTSYFIERLNAVIEDEASAIGARYLDLDAVASTYGKRYVSDEVVHVQTHGGILNDAGSEFDYANDSERISGPKRRTDYYPHLSTPFAALVGREIEAIARTWRRIDEVKMVVWDLDDTLWRGVAAEGNGIGSSEGWPRGLYDAIRALHYRGILQSVISKNDPSFIHGSWERLMGPEGILLDTFFSLRIAFAPKPVQMLDLLSDVGISPRAVVFVDDNPVERDAMVQAFPEMRVLGSNHLLLKRILLHAPETQVPVITNETSNRSNMVRAQMDRETARRSMSEQDFLASLNLEVTISAVGQSDHAAMQRALELINRSNQYNTTGARYTDAEFRCVTSNGVVYIAHAKDRFTSYGLVSVVLVKDATILQFVMSCRVIGLGIERAVIAEVHRRLTLDGTKFVSALLSVRDTNRPCHRLWADCGYAVTKEESENQTWRRPLDMGDQIAPRHVKLTPE